MKKEQIKAELIRLFPEFEEIDEPTKEVIISTGKHFYLLGKAQKLEPVNCDCLGVTDNQELICNNLKPIQP